jgi:hypothetical protein
MRPLPILSILGALLAPLPALADPIALFGTGVTAGGAPLPAGSVDPHYTSLTMAPGLTTSNYLAAYNGGTPVTDPTYVPTTNYWGGLNVISASQSGVPGTVSNQAFTYRTTFDLTGFTLASVVIDLNYYTDDQGEIALNGILIPSTFTNGSATASLTSGFVSGINTLDFVTFNQGGPGGVFVSIQDATADVPEPASLVLLSICLVGLGLVRQRNVASCQ